MKIDPFGEIFKQFVKKPPPIPGIKKGQEGCYIFLRVLKCIQVYLIELPAIAGSLIIRKESFSRNEKGYKKAEIQFDGNLYFHKKILRHFR